MKTITLRYLTTDVTYEKQVSLPKNALIGVYEVNNIDAIDIDRVNDMVTVDVPLSSTIMIVDMVGTDDMGVRWLKALGAPLQEWLR